MLKPRFLRLAALAAALAFAAPASAQLPNVGETVGGVIDRTPVPGVIEGVGEGIDGVREATVRELRNARETQRNLLRRQNRDVIDTDRQGEIVVRSEVVAIAPTPEALAAAQAQGFSITRTETHPSLGLTIVTLRAPARMRTREAVETLQELDPEGSYDFNHLYLGAGESGQAMPTTTRQSSGGGGGASARIGLIDSGVDVAHPALRGAQVRQRGFAGGDAVAAPHGTAIASLLAGSGGDFRGAAPGASLYVADVYGGRPTGGGAASIVAALSWLAEQRTPVINISLVGPRNRVLEAGVAAMIDRGYVIVAAVGNDGPAAPPLYPAAYPGVVGVTGVDTRDRVLPEAGRGAQVDLAAPGADMAAAEPGGGYVRVRGTSYASPLVAGLIARRMSTPNTDAARRAQAALIGEASDLGARGRDDTYGAGRVGGELRSAPPRVARR